MSTELLAPFPVMGGASSNIVNPATGDTYTLSARGSVLVNDADVAYFLTQGYIKHGSGGGGGGGGATTTFDTVAAVQLSIIPSGTHAIVTSGYYAAGDGGAGQYIVSPVQSADQGRIRSADGMWWQYVPDSRGINAKAFGAKADGADNTHYVGTAGAVYGPVNVTGTDNTQFIQDAIDFALRNGFVNVYLVAGTYVVAKTIHLSWGQSFATINLEGDNQPFVYGLPGTTIIFTAQDGSQCINVSGSRNSGIKRICFHYPYNYYWVYNNVWVVRGGNLTTNAATPTSSNVLHFASVPSAIAIGQMIFGPGIAAAGPPTVVSKTSTTVTMSANAVAPGVASGQVLTFEDPNGIQWILPSSPSSWVNPALTTALARHCPIAAITVDAFAGAQPSPSYPPVTYPAWTSLSGQYNKNAFSSGVHVRECSFQGWPVAFAQGVNTDSQGDFAVITDCSMNLGAYGISICNTQSRNVDVHNITFQFLHTLLDDLSFGGLGGGEWAGPISNLSGGECYQVFNFGGLSGPLEILNVYSEGGLRRLGRWLGNEQLKLSRWLISFDDSPYAMERTMIETYVYGPEITYEGCAFGNLQGIQQLVYGPQARTVLGSSNLFSSNGRMFPDNTVPGYQARSFGGGLILNGGAAYPANQNKVRGCSQADFMTNTGFGQARTWSDTDSCFSDTLYLYLWREGMESFRDQTSRKWEISQVTPSFTPPTNSGSIYKPGNVTGLAQVKDIVTFTWDPVYVNVHGYNHWGLAVGDILVDQPTGTLYVVTAVTRGTTWLVTAKQQNNYDNYPETGFVDRSVTDWTPTSPGTPSNIVNSGGSIQIIRTQQYISQVVYFGDFVAGSPNVANVHSGDLNGSVIASFLPPGTLLFAPGAFNGTEGPIAGEFPVTRNTYVGTVTNGGSGTTPGSLTLTAADLTTPVNAIATGRYPISTVGLRT